MTTLGKIWINIDKNEFRGIPEYDEILTDILNGKPIRLEKLAQKVKHYEKMK